MIKLNQINQIPQGLLELEDISKLHTILPRPTLLHIEGSDPRPLFVSVLLHANESTGFFAIQSLLKKYQQHPLPRSIMTFIGNIEASKAQVRRLDGQPDYNRVWPGGNCDGCAEADLMQQVIDTVSATNPFASIDIHNNTGKNPHYGCINKLENEFLHLASLFSRTVVFFESPKGVQSMAMAEHCPAITLECGKPDEPHGIEHARDYVDTVLHLESLSNKAITDHDVTVYHTVARVLVPESTKFDFKAEHEPKPESSDHDVCFETNFDKLNFSELAQGHVFGQVRTEDNPPVHIQAIDDDDNIVTQEFFTVRDNKLTLNKVVMPAMITLDKKIIRQDCLCYLMEPLDHLN